mmetsp:Transcript_5249/g.11487  ORF Transcript_5249/g.11487 Transcript_5249/m.11487 type:complete len:159 (+) Transcript_5249:135-611(+)
MPSKNICSRQKWVLSAIQFIKNESMDLVYGNINDKHVAEKSGRPPLSNSTLAPQTQTGPQTRRPRPSSTPLFLCFNAYSFTGEVVSKRGLNISPTSTSLSFGALVADLPFRIAAFALDRFLLKFSYSTSIIFPISLLGTSILAITVGQSGIMPPIIEC